MKRPWILFALVLLLACSSVDVEDLPTAITLTVDRNSAAVGDTLLFSYDATGEFMVGVIVDYGDGVLDSISAPGAQRANGSLRHSYVDPGSYTVIATLEEAIRDDATDTEVVEITGG